MGKNSQESGRKYWAIRSSVHSFGGTAHSFACSALLASLGRSTALIYSLARSTTHSRTCGKVENCMSENNLVLPHSALPFHTVYSIYESTAHFLYGISVGKDNVQCTFYTALHLTNFIYISFLPYISACHAFVRVVN